MAKGQEIQRVPVFVCPYCKDSTFRGGVGKRRLEDHVEHIHPEQMTEFRKMKLDEIRYYDGFSDKKARPPDPNQPNILSVPDIKQHNPEPLVQVEGETKPVEVKGEGEYMNQDDGKKQQKIETPPPTQTQILGGGIIANPNNEKVVIFSQNVPPTPPAPALHQVQQQVEHEQPLFPDWQNKDPLVWFDQFMKYYQFKPVFMKLQMDRARRLQQLPNTANFMSDLKTMDSGQSSLQQIQYIAQEYDAKLQEFMQTRQQDQFTGGGMGFPLNQRQGFQQQQFGGVPLNQPQTGGGFYQSETEKQLLQTVKDLQTQFAQEKERLQQQVALEKEKAQQRENDQLRQQIAKLEATVEQQKQMQQNPARNTDFDQVKLMLQQQNEALQREREERIKRDMEDIKRSQLDPDQVKAWMQDFVNREHDRITAKDIEQKIRDVVQYAGGTSQLDVDLKKAENEFQIKKQEIENDKEKTTAWQDALKEIAGTVAGGIGQAVAGRQNQPNPAMPPEPETTLQLACPSCNTPILAPIGLRNTTCPQCQSKLSISPEGIVTIIQPFPVQPPVQRPATPVKVPDSSVAPRIERNIPPPPPEQPPDDAEPDDELE